MTESNVSGPNRRTLKRLFAMSGNRCAFSNCRSPIIDGETVLGEVCHIKGHKLGAARHDPDQALQERHAYANLILFCRLHHKIVDTESKTYTVERLWEMKACHERSATAVKESESERAAELLMKESVASINQSGGITAHTVIINATTAREESRAELSLSPVAEYTFVSDGGEQIARTKSQDREGLASDFVYWHRGPTAWLRLIPSKPKSLGRAQLLGVVENAIPPLLPFGGGDSVRIFPNTKGVVAIGFDSELPETIATRIVQVFKNGEIWAHDRTLVTPSAPELRGTYRIRWPQLKMEFERALANYLQFAKQSLQIEGSVTVVAGVALVRDAEFVREKSKWFTDPPKVTRCLEESVASQWTIDHFDVSPDSLLETFYEAVFDACSLDYSTEPRRYTWPT